VKRFPVNNDLEANCVTGETALAGEVHHVARNSSGGAILTPVARYFAWHPLFIENFHEHCRVDCFVRRHDLAPEPIALAEALVLALIHKGICSEPIWLSVHLSEEVRGKAFGEVFDLD
jgi:hypothetical protein